MSAVLFTPRKTKRLRLHKVIPRGVKTNRYIPLNSTAAIFATDFGYLNWRHIEAGRRFLTRQLKRAKVKVRIQLTQPVTAKAKQARMGKGKGKFKGWVGFIRPGTLMYEMGNTSRKTWQEHALPSTRLSSIFPFEKITYKFPFKVEVRRRKAIKKAKTFANINQTYQKDFSTITKAKKHMGVFFKQKNSNLYTRLLWAQIEKFTKVQKTFNSRKCNEKNYITDTNYPQVALKNNASFSTASQWKLGKIVKISKKFCIRRKNFMKLFNHHYKKLSQAYPWMTRLPSLDRIQFTFKHLNYLIFKVFKMKNQIVHLEQRSFFNSKNYTFKKKLFSPKTSKRLKAPSQEINQKNLIFSYKKWKQLKKKIILYRMNQALFPWNLVMVKPIRAVRNFKSLVLCTKQPAQKLINFSWFFFLTKLFQQELKKEKKFTTKQKRKWKKRLVYVNRKKRIKKHRHSYWWHQKIIRSKWLRPRIFKKKIQKKYFHM